jgi:hypothetical protein
MPLSAVSTENPLPGVRGFTLVFHGPKSGATPSQHVRKRPARNAAAPLDIMLRAFILISLDALRVILRSIGAGHLVIVCSDFAFIAASVGTSHR